MAGLTPRASIHASPAFHGRPHRGAPITPGPAVTDDAEIQRCPSFSAHFPVHPVSSVRPGPPPSPNRGGHHTLMRENKDAPAPIHLGDECPALTLAIPTLPIRGMPAELNFFELLIRCTPVAMLRTGPVAYRGHRSDTTHTSMV
ncbi:hypothetical protein N7532_005428 [Penicillium argentinense]|uniref:Uncharacterized protein n=1 Tax=Penicillium argentinense TaxID=1131581 RepID=A0A9W9FDY4_9EURO|nr:uncharacterized protein N7532_005428 [Penicillium argentinense]KAJ5098427.1 hypothetical protein N7532_005428 [Penicillium argentinense]